MEIVKHADDLAPKRYALYEKLANDPGTSDWFYLMLTTGIIGFLPTVILALHGMWLISIPLGIVTAAAFTDIAMASDEDSPVYRLRQSRHLRKSAQVGQWRPIEAAKHPRKWRKRGVYTDDVFLVESRYNADEEEMTVAIAKYILTPQGIWHRSVVPGKEVVIQVTDTVDEAIVVEQITAARERLSTELPALERSHEDREQQRQLQQENNERAQREAEQQRRMRTQSMEHIASIWSD